MQVTTKAEWDAEIEKLVNETGFVSKCTQLGIIDLPEPDGTRIMMMPVVIGRADSFPLSLAHYWAAMEKVFDLCLNHFGKVGYLTIDEKHVKANETHRRAGLHVDGVYQGRAGGWGGGGGGGWGSHGNGMITVSNQLGCVAWNGFIKGWPGGEGECEHLRKQMNQLDPIYFHPGLAYWVDGLCVHESIPMQADTQRTFLRLSLPSDAPWFEGYTENPMGVKPTGEILPRREFMNM